MKNQKSNFWSVFFSSIKQKQLLLDKSRSSNQIQHHSFKGDNVLALCEVWELIPRFMSFTFENSHLQYIGDNIPSSAEAKRRNHCKYKKPNNLLPWSCCDSLYLCYLCYNAKTVWCQVCYFKKRKHFKDCRLVLAPRAMQPRHANTPHSLSVDFGVSAFYALLLLWDLRINKLPEPQFPPPYDAADYIFSWNCRDIQVK